jgi:hypothetical protein
MIAPFLWEVQLGAGRIQRALGTSRKAAPLLLAGHDCAAFIDAWLPLGSAAKHFTVYTLFSSDNGTSSSRALLWVWLLKSLRPKDEDLLYLAIVTGGRAWPHHHSQARTLSDFYPQGELSK